MKHRIDLSVVVTVHNEGLLAHKTMLSVFEGVSKIEAEGYSYEIIVHIDDGDKCTKDYFKRYNDNDNIRITTNCFNSLGLSRNYAVDVANGKYISFLAGDDLISDNWYIEALKKLIQSKEDIIVHPEAVLKFGMDQSIVLALQKPSVVKDIDSLLLLGENKWMSVAMAKKDVFVKTPYYVRTPGYGYEDYFFNVETVEKNIRHDIVEKTVLFSRQSEKSESARSERNHDVLPYTGLFSFDNLRKSNESVGPSEFEENKAIRRAETYRRIRSNKVVNALVTPLAVAIRKVTGKKPKVARLMPDYVLDEWLKINRVDTQLYPHQQLINGATVYVAGSRIEVGDAYCKIMQNVQKTPNYVFVAPFVTRGGAEKVLINYINALASLHKKWHFAVITTLPADNNWVSKLPDCVDIIDFGNNAVKLSWYERETLFSRIIIQLGCPNIHIINSEYGYRWMTCHKELLKKNYNTTASLFASSFVPGSNMKATFSYDNPYFLELHDVFKKVFTDNKNVIRESVAKNGYSEEIFTVHYQPVEKTKSIKGKEFEDGKFHILWAGRIVNLKLPKVVAEIGKKLDSNHFVIDIYGEMSDEVNKRVFDGVKTIKYHGAYDSFDSLMEKKFDLFLYTSLSDGIPNTILEAASYGIPIVASNDGGVGEVVQDRETGLLIDDFLNYDSYVKAIKELSSDKKERDRLSSNAKRLVDERHSWGSFIKRIEKDFAG